MNTYEKWLFSEKEWIGEYCKKTKKMSVLKVVPSVLIILVLLFCLLSFVNGDVTTDNIIESAAAGLMLGIFVCVIYILFLFPSLSPKKYVRKIDKTVNKMKFNDFDKELLAKEFLEAEADDNKTILFDMSGPHSKNTPARFVVSEHFAMLEGGYPYAIIVRLSDINDIKASQEKKTAATRSGNVKRTYFFTLYTIGFYRKDRAERGLSENDLPDEAMGFFDMEIRDRAIKMLEEKWD